jgi:hypothetical protein
MNANFKTALGMAPLFIVTVLATLAPAQTLFTTRDYKQDRELWGDPAYFNHNTARDFLDMHEKGYGTKGSGKDEFDITSPYSYKTSWDHFQAWLKAAGGGTKHTLSTLPDWDGYWDASAGWLSGNQIQVSTIVKALTPQYQEYYVQQTKAEAEGRAWWPSAFCLPDGFIRGVQAAEQFIVRPNQVVIINNVNSESQIRRIYTDGSGHVPEDQQFPRWLGESVGFWHGHALVVHTNQIRQWNASHSMLFEFSDQMTAVERYERKGDTIVGEITLYDPVAFVKPLHASMKFDLIKDPMFRSDYNTCTDSDGPSTNVYVTEDGILAQRTPGEPGYWDGSDPRPWAAHYALGEK